MPNSRGRTCSRTAACRVRGGLSQVAAVGTRRACVQARASERAGGQWLGWRADGLAGEVVWWCSHAVGFDAYR